MIDRFWFKSVYFREPGGVLFELATDGPGFAVDEDPAHLGEALVLPPFLEAHRAAIESVLPVLKAPVSAARGAKLMATSLDFIHVYEPPSAAGRPTLLMLHGTGGNEHDLVPAGRALLPGAGILSPRGKVLERGMPRFFRRLAEGVFDLDDLKFRAAELAAFVAAAAAALPFRPGTCCRDGFLERREHRVEPAAAESRDTQGRGALQPDGAPRARSASWLCRESTSSSARASAIRWCHRKTRRSWRRSSNRAERRCACAGPKAATRSGPRTWTPAPPGCGSCRSRPVGAPPIGARRA